MLDLLWIACKYFSTRKRVYFDIISLLSEVGDHFFFAHRTSMMFLFHHAKFEKTIMGNLFTRERAYTRSQ
jgi:hypothetical protein